jgi:carboxyl-terminal processing protease
MKLLVLTCLLFLSVDILFGQSSYQKDFNEFLKIIDQNYAYLEKQSVYLSRIKEVYEPYLPNISAKDDFVRLLESVLNEFYNGHLSLSTNLNSSNNIIPSGSDLYVEKIKSKFIITDIRQNGGAESCGLRPGMEVTGFNNASIPDQLKQFLPKSADHYTKAMMQYAISMLFAGTHDKKRIITVVENGKEKNYFPDENKAQPLSSLSYKVINKNSGYIKINNSLGDYELITEFDKALDSLLHLGRLIIDLTETPSGGNTTVARAIMGRFTPEKLAYQQHETDEKPYNVTRYWVEYVLPRKPIYKGQVLLLVGHWTGSMGEGMAIGFDRMKNVTVIGTRMAGLIGAISHFDLPETKIGFQIPTERLYHINGTPREDYIPKKLTQNIYETLECLNK